MHFVCFVTVKFFFFHQRIPLEVAIELNRKDIASFLTDGSFHVKSTQKNPYPHRFERKLVPTQCQLRH